MVYVNNNLHIESIDPFSSVSAEWTVLEAVLKLFGRGFADFLNTGVLCDGTEVACFRLSLGGGSFYITLAKK
jgi:hypothetical protein